MREESATRVWQAARIVQDVHCFMKCFLDFGSRIAAGFQRCRERRNQ